MNDAEMQTQDFKRLITNYLNSVENQNLTTTEHIMNFGMYYKDNVHLLEKKYKVALCFICLNPPYWQYASQVIEGAREYFLPGHQTDFLLWSDMPEETNYGGTVFPTEPIEWPMPTLMRYHLFLQQEEKLKEYDYVFYCDLDMKFVDYLGDELLGEHLTVAQHPMYALRRNLQYPYEPNPESAAYIPQLGVLDSENRIFNQVYAAGGLQGGKTEDWISAMKEMRDTVDADFANNYTARWNDESHWNKYLYSHPEMISVVLNPSYVYPDSLINEYYVPIWGKNYKPKLITLTKPFTISKEGGSAVNEVLQTMRRI